MFEDGTKRWYLDGKLHRENGPAIEHSSGTKEWYLNGTLHRENGPAVECGDSVKELLLNNIKFTEEEFNKEMNLIKKTSY